VRNRVFSLQNMFCATRTVKALSSLLLLEIRAHTRDKIVIAHQTEVSLSHVFGPSVQIVDTKETL
jgi:hypothetical protein